MSPSENDLRAALSDGEGDDRPDVDGLIAHVRGRRAQRRTRVLSTAAAVVVVAAAAVGGAALWGGSDGDGQHAAGPSPSVGGSAATTSVAAIGTPCPTTAPRTLDPPGPTPTTAPELQMFATPVTTVVVCAYTEIGSAGRRPAQVTFTGADATALATSIETASPSKLKIVCPDIVTADKTQLAIIGVTASGTQLPIVTTDVSVPNCNQPITNGTAVRYAWKPPADLAGRIAALSARGNAGSTDPGTVTGPTSGTTTGLPTMSTTSGKIGTPVR